MMRSAFVSLAGCVVALYAATFVAGLMVAGPRFFAIHFALGLCTVLFTLLTHCAVMTYLIISGKMVRLAVEQSRLDTDCIVRTKELKAQTFPFMVAAILLLLAAVFFGGASTNQPEAAVVHLIASLLAAGYNTLTFLVEYRTITRSTQLNEHVLRQHNQVRERGGRSSTLVGHSISGS